MNDILSVENLVKVYPKGPKAVDGVSFTLREGGIFAFLGPNGAGKTTTLKIIAGLCRPTSGFTAVNGVTITKDRNRYLKYLGVVSQHYNVDPDLTGRENMTIHAMLHGIKAAEAGPAIKDHLLFAGLLEHEHMLVGAYSGGMKRKLQIVRALLHNPRLIVLDEPTAGLDIQARRKIWELLKRLAREGRTIFFSTHYIEEAQTYADLVGIIHNGKLIAFDSPKNLIQSLGVWRRETAEGGTARPAYFTELAAAKDESLPVDEVISIRRTKLDDVFISLTGEEEFL